MIFKRLLLSFLFLFCIYPSLIAQDVEVTPLDSLINVPEKPLSISGFTVPLIFGGGMGSQNNPVLTTPKGDEATISAGGGLFFGSGIYYTTERNITVGASVQYLTSELTPVTKNGSASFKRVAFLPEIKLPIKIKDNSFINYGGGVGLYMNGKLVVDSNDDTQNSINTVYENTSGLHFILEYEENYPTGLLTAGVKYYNVEYEQASGDTLFPRLDGSGVDFYLSYVFKL